VPAESVGALVASLERSKRSVSEAIIAGLARGWPKDRPAKLDAESETAMVRLLDSLSPEARGQLAGLGTRWGARGFEKYTAEISEAFLKTVRDESNPDRPRIDAARQLVEFRRSEEEPARALLVLITPRTNPALATGLIEAIGRTEATGVGSTLV